MLVAQNSLGPVCPVPLTVRGSGDPRRASSRRQAPNGVSSYPLDRADRVRVTLAKTLFLLSGSYSSREVQERFGRRKGVSKSQHRRPTPAGGAYVHRYASQKCEEKPVLFREDSLAGR